MKRKRIIIEYDDSEYLAEEALLRVAHVAAKGLISECASGPHFCWATIWKDKTVVWTKRKATKDSADSFRVYRDPNA